MDAQGKVEKVNIETSVSMELEDTPFQYMGTFSKSHCSGIFLDGMSNN